jgi:hypothetical protein
MSVNMFRPVASASEPIDLAPVPWQWAHERTPQPTQNTAASMTALKERQITLYISYTVMSATTPRLM